MVRIEWFSRTKLQVINESIVSSGKGYRHYYLFGIKIFSKVFDEDFEEKTSDNKEENTVGFKKVKK